MFAAFNWNEFGTEVLQGGIRGAVLGAGLGLIAYLTRKPNNQDRAGTDMRERDRVYAQLHPKAVGANTTSRWLLLALPVMIGAGALIGNPSLVASLFRGGNGTSAPGAPSDESKPSATIIDFGRYRDKESVHVASDRTSSDGISVTRHGGLAFLEQTDQIPCRVGETWGFRMRVSNVPANRPYTVRRETQHPPMTFPDGSVRTSSVRESKMRPGESVEQFCGWHLLKGYEYELVAGEWVVMVFIDDTEVARKVFHLRK